MTRYYASPSRIRGWYSPGVTGLRATKPETHGPLEDDYGGESWPDDVCRDHERLDCMESGGERRHVTAQNYRHSWLGYPEYPLPEKRLHVEQYRAIRGAS